MTFKRTPMRYAHTNGFTSCTYTDDGKSIITAGADGDMRKWQGIDDDDPTSECLGECIFYIVQQENRLLVANDLNVVQAYTYPEIDRDGIMFRFTSPSTCITAGKDFLAAACDDGEIRVMKKDDVTSEFILTGHQGPVLHMDINENDVLASSSGDGTIKVWDLNAQKEIKTITNSLVKYKISEGAKNFSTPSFHPKGGKSMAYPDGKKIVIVSTSNWERQTSLSDDNIKGNYSCCSFSLCGSYLAAGTDTGEISVWDFPKKELIGGETSSRESEGITMIQWNPSNNGEFAYCDITGQLGTVVGCDKKEKTANNIVAAESNEVNFGDLRFEDDEAEEDNRDVDDDDDDGISLDRLKDDSMRDVDGISNNDSDDDDDKRTDVRSARSVSVERVITKKYDQQPPFQPGSSPSGTEHRYLVWNNVGIVRAHNTDEEGSIDVEFHDVSVHHAIYMKNYMNHTMASLSTTVLALAGDTSTKLVCITFGGAGSREWSMEMPDCEGILAVAATNTLVAVATENRLLRMFSVMGTQREAVSIPGPVVALAGQDNKIMVAFHSAPASEDQYISVMLMQSFGLSLRCRIVNLPLAPGKKLTWIGYSDCGSPSFCDTSGMVQMYSPKTNLWYPICNTAQHATSISNNYFVIDVNEKTQTIQAVLCRGMSYPVTSPRPVVSELPMQMPLCEIDSEKTTLEEQLARHSTFLPEGSERTIKETAIKLFALACRSEMEARARELVEMVASPQLLELAVKYASKLGRIHLADKLSELLPQIEQQEKEREKQMQEAEDEAMNILRNSPLNSGLLLLSKAMTPTIAPSPQLTPKPLSVSQLRRNPFKRSSTGGTPTSRNKDNPLKHLTEKAIGFGSKKPDEKAAEEEKEHHQSKEASQLQTNDSEELLPSDNDENKAKNDITPSTPVNFMTWFNEHKDELKNRNPDISAADLTKVAMKEYRAFATELKKSPQSAKRKLELDGTEKQSGIAKLAKFGFKK